MLRQKQRRDDEKQSFISGLIAGLAIGIPIAVWMTPHSGSETRQNIRQRGVIIRRKAGSIVRKPIEQAQSQIGQLQDRVEKIKGDSVEDALAEGKAIAAARRG